jgi:hypothetical protein
MSAVARLAYGVAVRAHTLPPRHGPDPLRHPCVACAHSEFVHGDEAPRGCLYSECECPTFTAELVAVGAGTSGRTAA